VAWPIPRFARTCHGEQAAVRTPGIRPPALSGAASAKQLGKQTLVDKLPPSGSMQIPSRFMETKLMAQAKPQATKTDAAPTDSSEVHQQKVPPRTNTKPPPRPGAKGQPEPRARKRVIARQRGPR
jgi:hypothetical protein